MMAVETRVDIYETDGTRAIGLGLSAIKVHSHWNDKDFTVIELPDGKKYTVVIRDLEMALQNARNCR